LPQIDLKTQVINIDGHSSSKNKLYIFHANENEKEKYEKLSSRSKNNIIKNLILKEKSKNL
jgi:hypothetical protein